MSDEPIKNPEIFAIGEDLYGVSVDELQSRIEVLKNEVTRIEAELAKKKKERSAADSLFR